MTTNTNGVDEIDDPFATLPDYVRHAVDDYFYARRDGDLGEVINSDMFVDSLDEAIDDLGRAILRFAEERRSSEVVAP